MWAGKAMRSHAFKTRPEMVASSHFSPWAPVWPQSVFQAGKGLLP